MSPTRPRAPRVLLVAATTGYQIRSFRSAAERLGVELVLATDRCRRLDDPWRDGAVAVPFHDEDAAVRAIVEESASAPFQAVLAVGDRPALIGALAARSLGLRGHPPAAVRVAGHKLKTRRRMRADGLRTPWFRSVSVNLDNGALLERIAYPCVVKPLGMAASRGVIRADTPAELAAAAGRVRRLLATPEVRALRDPANDSIAVEEYIPGREVAVEGLMTDGRLQVLAIFDKPDPLEGPFFEESIYVTPDRLPPEERLEVIRQADAAVQALGLKHGPVHAECRLGPRGVVVLEVAARPIGGLCSRVLRFDGPAGDGLSLEELLLRHALGRPVVGCRLSSEAAAVMMIPVPDAGIFQGIDGLDAARSVPLIQDVVITTKPGQRLVPWPEGASYPGFIFARGRMPDDVVAAVRTAHGKLAFRLATGIPVAAGTGRESASWNGTDSSRALAERQSDP